MNIMHSIIEKVINIVLMTILITLTVNNDDTNIASGMIIIYSVYIISSCVSFIVMITNER